MFRQKKQRQQARPTVGADNGADLRDQNLSGMELLLHQSAQMLRILRAVRMVRGRKYAHTALRVHGRHNILNALAAASAAYALGLPGEAVEEGLAGFTGAGRRFERKGSYHGAEVYDDYAHHPDELHDRRGGQKSRHPAAG